MFSRAESSLTNLEARLNALPSLDSILTKLVTALYQSVPFADWHMVRLFSKYTPDASVSAHDFDFVLQDGKPGLYRAPSNEALGEIEALTKEHWRLTQNLGQPRWYKLTATVERDGKFSVDFEYKDDYKEGDIMKRG